MRGIRQHREKWRHGTQLMGPCPQQAELVASTEHIAPSTQSPERRLERHRARVVGRCRPGGADDGDLQ